MALAVCILTVLAGCASVGPDYAAPDPSAPRTWSTILEDGLKAEPIDPRTLAAWWTTLNDPILSSLVERAVAGSLDLDEARARVLEARGKRKTAKAGFFPAIDAAGSHTRSRSSKETGGGTETELSSAGFDASWEVDLFGSVRRSVEASTADLEASTEDLRDVLVSLLAEVALNYVDTRAYQSRIDVAEKNLESQEETYRLTFSRHQAGLTDELAVQQAKYNLESTRSQIPTLRAGLETAMNRLAVLLGEHPGALHRELREARPIPVTPPEIAVGIPAEALRRRPDVRRAERELAAQTARVGVATAHLYPKLTLSGSIGLEALSIANLFVPGSRTSSFGPALSWPLFDAGAIRSNIEAQSALQEQALIQYRCAVLKALEEVENALVAYAREQERRRALAESAKAAQSAAKLAEDQFASGLIDFSDVLDAQRSLLTFQDELAESDGTVASNLVRLYKALGGGWTPLSPETASEGATKDTKDTENMENMEHGISSYDFS